MNAYEKINEIILQKLEEGTIPWFKPWATIQTEPENFVSKAKYRGINKFITIKHGSSKRQAKPLKPQTIS